MPLSSPHDPIPYGRLALALSLGAAVSLGITRFAYGLLLPPMREDLPAATAFATSAGVFIDHHKGITDVAPYDTEGLIHGFP